MPNHFERISDSWDPTGYIGRKATTPGIVGAPGSKQCQSAGSCRILQRQGGGRPAEGPQKKLRKRSQQQVPATVAASLHGIVRPPRGPSRPEMRKELFEGIVDKLTHPVGDESPEEKERIARWTRAKTLHAEVKGLRSQLAQLTGTGSPRPQPLGSEAPAAAGGAEACTAASAAEAFFPAGWREALSIELLADLVIDAWLPSFADSVVEELAATVEERTTPPPTTTVDPGSWAEAALRPASPRWRSAGR
ncbi:unnamed protein product [Prorocentrum cordatum]|uniref:Uncharacterized protein n=1 Tax=Prorocentrum cordatum TaxID=2364126 RepID=A0ABN9UP37_9DINO|nr:unnamed protein product [Polarella glacialis]